MLRTTVHLCNIGCFQSNRVCQNSDLFRKRRHWNKPQTATFFKQQKRFWKNPEEQNTRTAPEEVLQFVQKNAQQSKLTTVNKLQAPQHLFCFFRKRIQQFHLFCNTCKTPMWPKNKAIIFVPKRTCLFFGNKGRGQQRVITNPKQKREVEKRDTQYARNKINVNHAHAIRRSGIYSDRHVRKTRTTWIKKCTTKKNWHAKHTNLNRLMPQVKWQGWTMRQSPLFSLSAWMLWSSGETNGSDMFSDWKSFWSWTFGFGFQSDHIHWLLSRLLHVCSSMFAAPLNTPLW